MKINASGNIDNASETGAQPPAGSKGFYLQSIITSGSALPTTETAGDVTSITLTPGTWLVSGAVSVSGTGITALQSQAWLGTTVGNSFAEFVSADTGTYSTITPLAALDAVMTLPAKIYSVSVNTIIYLKVSCTYALIGNGVSTGSIKAVCIS